MYLTEHLSASGVSLGREVGVIIEETDSGGNTKVTCARIARVCAGIPVDLLKPGDVEDFDPEYDIAVLWGTSEKQVCILRMTNDASLYKVDQGGLIIESAEGRIIIGQADTFMNSVCELMCALAQPI
jgi:hypothetical protein